MIIENVSTEITSRRRLYNSSSITLNCGYSCKINKITRLYK